MKEVYQEVHVQHGTMDFNFAVYEYVLTPGFHFLYSHWHHEYEIIYVDYGELTFELNGKPITLHSNQAIFVNSYQIHSCCCSPTMKCRYICIVFGEQFVFPNPHSLVYQKYILPINKNNIIPPKTILGNEIWERDALAVIYNLCEISLKKEDGYELELQLGLMNIFNIMLKNHAFISESQIQDCTKFRIKEAISIIHLNYNTPLKIDDIAQNLNVCTEHFIRSFKKYVGKTPKEYIMQYRIDQARALLLSTDFSITYIAEQCGFYDMSYFSRCFKRLTGKTPLGLRNEQKS